MWDILQVALRNMQQNFDLPKPWAAQAQKVILLKRGLSTPSRSSPDERGIITAGGNDNGLSFVERGIRTPRQVFFVPATPGHSEAVPVLKKLTHSRSVIVT